MGEVAKRQSPARAREAMAEMSCLAWRMEEGGGGAAGGVHESDRPTPRQRGSEQRRAGAQERESKGTRGEIARVV